MQQVWGLRSARSRVRLLAALMVVGLAFGAAPLSAQARPEQDPDTMVPTARYDPGSCLANGAGVCRTDNAAVSYYMDSKDECELEQVDRDVVSRVMKNEYNPTDLTVKYDSSPAFTGSAETDIVYRECNVPSGALGITRCNDPASGYECDQQYVEIRGGGEYDYGTTCHETGHAVGLLHGPDSTNEYGNAYSSTDPVLGCLTTPAANVGLGALRKSDINQQY